MVVIVVVGGIFVEKPEKARNAKDFLPTGPVEKIWRKFWLCGKTGNIHRTGSTFPQNPVDFSGERRRKKGNFLSVPVVDIGADILHHLGDLGVGFTEFFDAVNGVQDSGMVPVFKLLADLL